MVKTSLKTQWKIQKAHIWSRLKTWPRFCILSWDITSTFVNLLWVFFFTISCTYNTKVLWNDERMDANLIPCKNETYFQGPLTKEDGRNIETGRKHGLRSIDQQKHKGRHFQIVSNGTICNPKKTNKYQMLLKWRKPTFFCEVRNFVLVSGEMIFMNDVAKLDLAQYRHGGQSTLLLIEIPIFEHLATWRRTTLTTTRTGCW